MRHLRGTVTEMSTGNALSAVMCHIFLKRKKNGRLFKQSDVSGQPEFWKYWMKTEKISPRAQRNSEETGQGDSQSHQVGFQKVMTYKQYMWLQIKR